MNIFRKVMLAIATMGCLATAPMAAAVPFEITAASFTPGSGYGIDADEDSGTLLDVRFVTSGTFTPRQFDLSAIGQFLTFNFGTVNLQELNAKGGINNNEIDNLGVTASFTFTNPLGVVQNILATGTAITGSVSDSFVDYTIVWTPLMVAFGTGGVFEIAMNNLSFADQGSQVQTATITLKGLPQGVVPEPATIALLGLGLLGFATMRRRASDNKAA